MNGTPNKGLWEQVYQTSQKSVKVICGRLGLGLINNIISFYYKFHIIFLLFHHHPILAICSVPFNNKINE